MADNDNTDLDESLERQLELATLLPERWYIIFSNKDDDTVTMNAYDTTTGPEDPEAYESGVVLQNGIIELLENDFERIVEAGMARLRFKEIQKDIVAEVNEEMGLSIETPGDNIIKVDFGAKQ